MTNKISCNITKDLMPLYLDGLTSSESNLEIEDHLNNCENCRSLIEGLKDSKFTDLEHSGFSSSTEDSVTIDFLKKSRKKLKRGFIFGITTIVALCLCLVFARGYFSSHETTAEMIEISEMQIKNGSIHIDGFLTDSSQGVKSINYSVTGGEVSVDIKSGLKTIFSKNKFSSDFSTTEQINSVKLSNSIIWDNGTEIPKYVSKVFAAKHSYIGSMPDNEKSAMALGISDTLGSFTNELHTAEEPYGWTMILEDDMYTMNNRKLQEQLEYYSAVLIATIENLEYVCFEYHTDGIKQSFQFNSAEADAHYGSSVKKAAETASGLYTLMREW